MNKYVIFMLNNMFPKLCPRLELWNTNKVTSLLTGCLNKTIQITGYKFTKSLSLSLTLSNIPERMCLCASMLTIKISP